MIKNVKLGILIVLFILQALSPIILVKMAEQMTIQYVFFCKLVKQMELHKTLGSFLMFILFSINHMHLGV